MSWRCGDVDLQCQTPVLLQHAAMNVLYGLEPRHTAVMDTIRFIVKHGEFFNLTGDFTEIGIAVGRFPYRPGK